MMREILFRGKDEDTGEWLQSMTISKHYYNDEEIFSYYIGHGNRTIDAKTLGQYTGLKDKNGTKIFEGDILLIKVKKESVSKETREDEHRTTGCVVFEGGEFYLEGEGMVLCTYYGLKVLSIPKLFSFYEVIGNIHDNPELMKGGAE